MYRNKTVHYQIRKNHPLMKRKHSIIKLDFLSSHKRDCSTTTSYLHFQQNGNGNKNQTHANYKEEDVVASMKRSRRKEARVISFKLRRPSLLVNSYMKTIFCKKPRGFQEI